MASYLDRKENPCSEVLPRLDYHDCVWNFVGEQVGCRLPWNRHSPDKLRATCETRKQAKLDYFLKLQGWACS